MSTSCVFLVGKDNHLSPTGLLQEPDFQLRCWQSSHGPNSQVNVCNSHVSGQRFRIPYFSRAIALHIPPFYVWFCPVSACWRNKTWQGNCHTLSHALSRVESGQTICSVKAFHKHVHARAVSLSKHVLKFGRTRYVAQPGFEEHAYPNRTRLALPGVSWPPDSRHRKGLKSVAWGCGVSICLHNVGNCSDPTDCLSG